MTKEEEDEIVGRQVELRGIVNPIMAKAHQAKLDRAQEAAKHGCEESVAGLVPSNAHTCEELHKGKTEVKANLEGCCPTMRDTRQNETLNESECKQTETEGPVIPITVNKHQAVGGGATAENQAEMKNGLEGYSATTRNTRQDNEVKHNSEDGDKKKIEIDARGDDMTKSELDELVVCLATIGVRATSEPSKD